MLVYETFCKKEDVHNLENENYVKLEDFEQIRSDCYVVYKELIESRKRIADLERKLKEEKDKNNVNSKNSSIPGSQDKLDQKIKET